MANDLLLARKQYFSSNLSLSYEEPLSIIRGKGQYLYDESGKEYLDCVNNVCHVGHCHPMVIEAASKQLEILNTNTRYLHANLTRLAEKLTDTFPDPLKVCFFTNSGSEANDLALRLARTTTKAYDVIVLDFAYHGNTTACIEISPYKYEGPGGFARRYYVHQLPIPDMYRDPLQAWRDSSVKNERDFARVYAEKVQQVLDDIKSFGRSVAAFICESVLGCAGQIVLPSGYLGIVYSLVRQAGGLCIADEVQVGFGRVGTKFWGYQLQDVIPDIVTMGKPMGNGFPLAGVVTTRKIADAFSNGMEYFNTFGGNPVSCAVGISVLETIEREKYGRHAATMGEYIKAHFRTLQKRFPNVIGDIRGVGLFFGMELVQEQNSKKPNASLTRAVVNKAKARGVLLSIDGPFHNVIKIKPPMCITAKDIDRLSKVLWLCFLEETKHLQSRL